jgi:hypothetical protein
MRLARGAQLGLAVLLVASVVAAVIAVVARNNAVEQARVATARQLAAISATELPTNLDIAQLLAVRAYRTDQNAQTRAALLRAVTASPQLVRYLPMGAPVTELAGSGDGGTVVAGLANGQVVYRRLAEPAPQTVHAFSAPVSSIAVSRDGAVVVACDGSSAVLWQQGRGLSQLDLPAGHRAHRRVRIHRFWSLRGLRCGGWPGERHPSRRGRQRFAVSVAGGRFR